MAFMAASTAEPLLSRVQAAGDIQPVGKASASSSASVLAPAIRV